MKTFYFYTKPQKKNSRLSFAGVFNEDTKTIMVGIARCNKVDHFVKKVGRELAEERAMNKPFDIILLEENTNPAKEFLEFCKPFAIFWSDKIKKNSEDYNLGFSDGVKSVGIK